MAFPKRREYAPVPPPPTLITHDPLPPRQQIKPAKKHWFVMHCERCHAGVYSLRSYYLVGRRCRKCGGFIAKGKAPGPRKNPKLTAKDIQDVGIPDFKPAKNAFKPSPMPF